MKTCKRCGKEFTPDVSIYNNGTRQVYCSTGCRQARKHERAATKKICEWCKEEFVAAHPGMKYCKEHRLVARRAASREWWRNGLRISDNSDEWIRLAKMWK